MDALNLVLANDGVLKSAAVLDGKDSVLVASFGLASALDTTAIGLHLAIEGTLDFKRLLVGDSALALGDGEGGALAQRDKVVGSGGSRASGGEASDGSDNSKRELHCDGC